MFAVHLTSQYAKYADDGRLACRTRDILAARASFGNDLVVVAVR